MKLCEKCGLNYINDDETLCEYCKDTKAEINIEKYKKIEITDPIEREYLNFLVDWGYKEETEKGLKSTAYEYVWAINFVKNREIITYETLIVNIDKYIKEYDKFGKNQKIGALGHNTIVCSLKKFREFIIYKIMTKNNADIKVIKK